MKDYFTLSVDQALSGLKDSLLSVPAGETAKIAAIQGQYAGLTRAKDLYRAAARRDVEDDQPVAA